MYPRRAGVVVDVVFDSDYCALTITSEDTERRAVLLADTIHFLSVIGGAALQLNISEIEELCIYMS